MQPPKQPQTRSSLLTSASTVAIPSSSRAASEAPSTNPAAPTAGLKTRRGIIASGAPAEHLASAFTNSKVSWLANWYSAPPHQLAPGMTFVPQNYGKKSDENGDWTKNAQQAVKAGDKYMLSFGEPGTPNAQLHMDPKEAVDLWMAKMEPFAKQGVSIGAPGTLQNTQDFEWLSQFLSLCNECSIGFLAMHWYDKAELKNVQGLKDTLNKAAAIAQGRSIWLANFQADGTPEAQQEFLGEVIPWLDAQENIQAYAYVPTDSSTPGASYGMVDDQGNLNALGQLYATL
ncbi:uncharacterized protein ALTATR162_LOCUS141 [Alternaria atra]|uniref:Asl1-like glycosyl hydrolase catalytic domain-containing protein n=1 Tax=Alternaria atra TaxID=119953 RepID=A0A8J2HS02_9PLEO|nr:uncharacterized protein ALTATR162_LOCUS141 [Alternaria atra]CAG5137541.1 unnamed protein product [Alternaria atra]